MTELPEVALANDDGTVVCERCLLAETPFARLRGLLGRSGLSSGEGLLLRPAGSIHTAFMRFTIDAVFLDAADRVEEDGVDREPHERGVDRASRPEQQPLTRGEAAASEQATQASERCLREETPF